MISVIIPTYNRETTICRAIDSVLNQTYKNLECIVIDDASTDRTLDIISKYNDHRLKIIKCDKNNGASAARNIGIKEAQGNYITFHDSDDVLFPDKLEKQLNVLQRENVDFVFCRVNRYSKEREISRSHPVIIPFNNEKNQLDILLRNGLVWTQASFGKADLIKETLFNESIRCSVDWEWSLRIAKKAKMYYQEDILVSSYLQENSISLVSENAKNAFYYMYTQYHDDIYNSEETRKIWDSRIANLYSYKEKETIIPSWHLFKDTHNTHYLLKTLAAILVGKSMFVFNSMNQK